MATHANMCCRLFDRHNSLTHFRKLFVQCVNGSTQRLYSSAPHKENELELGDSTLAAPNFAASVKTRSRQVILTPRHCLQVILGADVSAVGV